MFTIRYMKLVVNGGWSLMRGVVNEGFYCIYIYIYIYIYICYALDMYYIYIYNFIYI